MSLLVQQFLKHNSLLQLKMQHGIYVSLSKNKRKISLNYDMIETLNSDVLSWDCRGLILSKHDFSEFEVLENGSINLDCIIGDTKIIAFGMKRFFNHGQAEAANIDWNNKHLSILEKLDGSLCLCYYDPYTCLWNIATRSCPEADIPLDGGEFTFRILFEKAVDQTCGLSFDEFTQKLDKNITYCFELTSPYNKIVVYYPNTNITLLAARDIRSVNELDIRTLNVPVPCVNSYKHLSLPDLIKLINSLSPIEHEGVVICDDNFNRIKIKSASYIAAHKSRFSIGKYSLMQLILSEKEDDVIPFLPEDIVNKIIKMKTGLHNFIAYYEARFIELSLEANSIKYNDKKTFAQLLQVTDLWQAPLFSMFNNKAKSIKEFIIQNKRNNIYSASFLDNLISVSDKYFN
jgi:hypothetical protein